ncbi:hypothetical protein E4T56_gene1409 [Termitomyces sp. T112]|nr:hypothetical protein E4T56_gene1409 [Termitomyces sp. T112]KAH0580864.1 hypothetical protein H2248_012023 [Termitomyces sp. 'cryptogamus']KNZ78302.1 hypothetical protein J132_01082 [Termitomyces sp. J132]
MPMVSINSQAGPANISYTISTPACTSAERIDSEIPTVIFLHPVYIGKYIFQTQFCDPKLRRFNLIGVDTRLHGDTEGKVKGVFGSEDAAHDMAAFMNALQLPPCHFFGLSMGTRIAIQMGISYPEKVLSLFLVSPIPIEEPAEVTEGRHEIYEYWCLGWSDPARPDIEAIKDSAKGSNQLGFNSTSGPLIKAMRKVTIPKAIRNYGPGRFEECYIATVAFFAEHVDYSMDKLRRIRCPVKLVHCSGDIAYPIHHAEELLQRLIEADVNADLEVVDDAPHFGTVTNATEINSLLHDFLMKQTTSDVPLPLEGVKSPYEAILIAAGWFPDHNDENPEEADLFPEFDHESLVLPNKEAYKV